MSFLIGISKHQENNSHKNRQEPSKSENDVLTVEDSLNGSGWFRLVPGVGNDANNTKDKFVKPTKL